MSQNSHYWTVVVLILLSFLVTKLFRFFMKSTSLRYGYNICLEFLKQFNCITFPSSKCIFKLTDALYL